MPLVTDKCVFLHIPKTGGVWVKHIMLALGLKPIDMGHQHEHFPAIFRFEPKEFFKDRFVFTMVRHPITWYKSRWAFRVKHGWQSRHPLDWNCATNDFHEFVEKVLKVAPDGWCSSLFNTYTDDDDNLVDFVGKTENLVDDFLQAMRMAGHDVDEDKVRSMAAANSSAMSGLSSSHWAKYTPELFDRVMAAESSLIQRYYWDHEIDPNDHCGPLPY